MTSANKPSDFPIPADLQGFFQWDKLHCPKPQTTLTQDLFNSSVSEGFSSAMDEYGCPVGMRYLNINTYAYVTMVPFDLGDETIEQRVGRYKENLQAILPAVGEQWEKEWLPSILPALDASRTRDYAALSDQQLIETLEQMKSELVERWTIHGKINYVLAAAGLLVDFYNEHLNPEDPTEAYEALQGYPTKSVEAGQGLWELGRIVSKSPELGQLFERSKPGQLMAELEKTEIGRTFTVALKSYLDEFG